MERLNLSSRSPEPGPAATISNTRFPDCDWGEGPSNELSENDASEELGLPLLPKLLKDAFPLTAAEAESKKLNCWPPAILIVYGIDTVSTPGASNEKFSLRLPADNASTGWCACPTPPVVAVACAFPDNVSDEASVFANVAPVWALVSASDVQLDTDSVSFLFIWSGIDADELKFVF